MASMMAYGRATGPCGLTIFGTGRTEGTAAQGKGIKMSGDSIRALCIRRTLSRHVTMGTPTVIFLLFDCFWLFLTIGVPIVTGLPRLYQQCTNSVPIVKDSQKIIKTAKMTTGVPIVTCLPELYQQCNNSVPIVKKNSQKQSNSKKWPLVYQSLHVYPESAEHTKSASASAEYTKPSKSYWLFVSATRNASYTLQLFFM